MQARSMPMHSRSYRRYVLAALVLLLLQALHASRATPSSTSWQHSLGSITVDGRPLPQLPSLSQQAWTHSLPPSALRKGMGYTGSGARLRRAMRDALRGRRLSIAFIGSGVTAARGTDTSAGGKADTGWAELAGNWAVSVFANATFRNGAVPATQSSYMVRCLERHVNTDADIIFVDYLGSDGFKNQIQANGVRNQFERLVRRLLSLPHKPAVVMMQTWMHGQTLHRGSSEWRPQYLSSEFVNAALAQYYDITYLSFMSATARLDHEQKAQLTFKDLMQTPLLLSDKGQKALADLAVALLQQTIQDLLLRPWDKPDVDLMSDALPPPMSPGNEAPISGDQSACMGSAGALSS